MAIEEEELREDQEREGVGDSPQSPRWYLAAPVRFLGAILMLFVGAIMVLLFWPLWVVGRMFKSGDSDKISSESSSS
jgi:hypothetical protein